MSENKKIKGARTVLYKGITFKSDLEYRCYKKLEGTDLNFSYESEKITLWEGVKPSNVLIYYPNKIRAGVYEPNLSLQPKSLIKITYTPDFIIKKGKYKIYFDVKGKENDVYPIKRKMFLKYLNSKNDGIKYMFFEPHNIKQMIQAIDIINSL